MTVRPESRPKPTTFAVWEAVIAYFIELGGETGKVERAQIKDGGARATIHATW